MSGRKTNGDSEVANSRNGGERAGELTKSGGGRVLAGSIPRSVVGPAAPGSDPDGDGVEPGERDVEGAGLAYGEFAPEPGTGAQHLPAIAVLSFQ